MARRAPGASAGAEPGGVVPNHRTASFTSPESEIHSVSASAGSASCGTPGAIFSAANGAARAASTAHDSGGEYASGSKIRPPRTRLLRAGSTNTASYPAVSTSVTSAHRTSISSARPSASAFARAAAQARGSRSTARTRIPARARAMASPPMPQQRSARVRMPSAASRAAR